MTVVEVQAPRPENLRCKIQLLFSVGDGFTAQKGLGPAVYFGGYLLGYGQKKRVFVDGMLYVPLVINNTPITFR